MEYLQETDIACPYCGEHIAVLLDPSDSEQEYIEDCQVCCRPIVLHITQGTDGDIHVTVRSEDDTG